MSPFTCGEILKRVINSPVQRWEKPRSNMNSYRGITLIPVLSKLFDKCIRGRLDTKLQHIKFPPPLQFAARKGSNSVMTSYCVQEIINSTMEKHGKVYSAFLDIEKCFDKVWWNGLLFKLHQLGITNNLWLLIRECLVNSTCVVYTNGVSSDPFTISRSIRQGGVLSMIMMAVAFHDIHYHMDSEYEHGIAYGNTYLGSAAFADDIVLMSNTKDGLQAMLDESYTYSTMWRFTFSAEKSKCIIFGESKLENNRNMTERTFMLNGKVLEEVQHITHVGVELCSYQSSNHRTESVCNKAHKVIANLTTAGVRPSGLNPIIMNNLWNKCGVTSLLYGSEVWSELCKSETQRIEKAQVRKLKLLLDLPRRTHDCVVRALLKQPTMDSLINIRKLNFLHNLVGSSGITKQLFYKRLYSGIFNEERGFMSDISKVLKKYDLQSYLRTFAQGGNFPTKARWKSVVKEHIMSYERNRCRDLLSQKGDVDRFLRIMGRNLFRKPYPLYVDSLRNGRRELVMLTKLACLPTMDTPQTCELCRKAYEDVTEHIIMFCTSLNEPRNNMWDELVNVLEVEQFVELWSKPEADILDIILGGRWPPFRDKSTRDGFYKVVLKSVKPYFKAIQLNIKWLRM